MRGGEREGERGRGGPGGGGVLWEREDCVVSTKEKNGGRNQSWNLNAATGSETQLKLSVQCLPLWPRPLLKASTDTAPSGHKDKVKETPGRKGCLGENSGVDVGDSTRCTVMLL